MPRRTPLRCATVAAVLFVRTRRRSGVIGSPHSAAQGVAEQQLQPMSAPTLRKRADKLQYPVCACHIMTTR